MPEDELPFTSEIEGLTQGNNAEEDVKQYLHNKLGYHLYQMKPDSFKIDFFCRYRYRHEQTNQMVAPTRGGFYLQVKSTSLRESKRNQGVAILLKEGDLKYWSHENLLVIIAVVDYIKDEGAAQDYIPNEIYYASFQDDIAPLLPSNISGPHTYTFTKPMPLLKDFIREKFESGLLSIPSDQQISKILLDSSEYYTDILKDRALEIQFDGQESLGFLKEHNYLKTMVERTYGTDFSIVTILDFEMLPPDTVMEAIEKRLSYLDEYVTFPELFYFGGIIDIIVFLEKMITRIHQAENLLISLKKCIKCGSNLIQESGSISNAEDLIGGYWRLLCGEQTCDYIAIDESS